MSFDERLFPKSRRIRLGFGIYSVAGGAQMGDSGPMGLEPAGFSILMVGKSTVWEGMWLKFAHFYCVA
jgi:hypothetical protein